MGGEADERLGLGQLTGSLPAQGLQPAAYQEGFDQLALGAPALVCRWRLAQGRLPLANRHLRALRERELSGVRLPSPLIAWAKEHIDWTLGRGSERYPDGVLLMVVDDQMRAAMAVGPYKELLDASFSALARRAQAAGREANRTNVAPETLWLVQNHQLLWCDDPTHVASGTATLVRDMAQTMGIIVERQARVQGDQLAEGQAFLVSDEHGVIVASDRDGMEADRYAEGYRKLLASVMRRQRLRDEKEA